MWQKCNGESDRHVKERECHQLPPAVPGTHCNDNYLPTEISVTDWKRDSDILNAWKKSNQEVFFSCQQNH